MALDSKFEHSHKQMLRDVRPVWERIAAWLETPTHAATLLIALGASFHIIPAFLVWADVIFIFAVLYVWWLATRSKKLTFRLPISSKYKDESNKKDQKPEGILYLGNTELRGGEEVWFSNSDARTHILYLGTTGAGKTEGLKSMVANALSWASGYVYIDGKADTDLWSSLSSLVRRFGRDDDLLVLNYMTGNSDTKAPSNSMNPFSSGSASYLTNMLVSLMPEAEGDNAMWKERAVSLIGALMPALTWKRDNQDIPTSVSTIRDYLGLNNVVRLSRDEAVPQHIRSSISGYLDTLPGYSDAAFDDDGREKPAGPGQPMIDTTTARQQHGYLAMQFTRSLQSLGDDYGYIFDTQAADVDMVDVVLNRRILIVLIPALEKSADETANLGKIVAATLKGMMGSTLGATVEGESATVIENKPTHSATPFMTVFDEVGYYTSSGMAVMAAQARSLGFSLVFSAQDLPALEKRVKEEARSITANCNIKIFGKLEDPTQTKDFFEKTVGSSFVVEMSGFQGTQGAVTHSYMDTHQASVQLRSKASYDGLRTFREGQAVIAFSSTVVDVKFFYSNPGFAKAMRVTRYMALPTPDENLLKHTASIRKLRDNMVKKNWTAEKADVVGASDETFSLITKTYHEARRMGASPLDSGLFSLVGVHALENPIDWSSKQSSIQAQPVEQKAPAQSAPQDAPQIFSSQPAAAPKAETQNAQGNTGNPMSFFGGGNATEEQQAQAAPQPVEQTPPTAAPAQAPAVKTQEALDAANLVRAAAGQARKSLLRGKKSQAGDIIEAAE